MRKTKPTLERRLIEGLENFADALEQGVDLTERFTCRKVVLNLIPTPYDPNLVKETRKILGASQVIFAHFLGVSPSIVQKWERGERSPSKMACRFMDEIRHDPALSRQRFRDLISARAL
jgi:putative transcriptional regulator